MGVPDDGMAPASPDPQDLARRAAEAMWAEDTACRSLDMSIEDVRPGKAVLAMAIKAHMVNGHGICHGGYIFLLADSAFAYACNSHNQRAVAQHCMVTYLKPGRLGDRLLAVAVERTREGRNGICDVTVTRADGTKIAEFRGFSRTIEGTLAAEQPQG